MCDCLKTVTENLQQKLAANVEVNSVPVKWLNIGSFQNIVFSFSGGPSKIGMPFIIEYYRTKKNGEQESRKTTQDVQIFPSYCPFCGEKYEKVKDELLAKEY